MSSQAETPNPGDRPTPWGLLASIVVALVIVVGAVVVAMTMGGGDDPVASADGTTDTVANALTGTKDLVGKPAPTSAYELFDGGTASLADYAGRPVVVNFFSSTCAPCLQEMPEFEAVKQAHGDDVAFIGMNVADSVQNGMGVVDATAITWDLGRDPQGDLLAEVGGVGMPTTMVIGADGTVTFVHSGRLSGTDLEAAIAEALGTDPKPVAPTTAGPAA